MANNAQAPAICTAIHDAVGVWVTAAAGHARARAARAGAQEGNGQPRREGKRVIFDEELSVNTVAPGADSPSRTPNAR